jgi:hypothetical protein
MTTHPSPNMTPVRVVLHRLTRCGFCGCPIESGRHTDTGQPSCLVGTPLRLCHHCAHDNSAHSSKAGCTARHLFLDQPCRCGVHADDIRGNR